MFADRMIQWKGNDVREKNEEFLKWYPLGKRKRELEQK